MTFVKSTFSGVTGLLVCAGVRGPAARKFSGFTAPFNLKMALCRGHADRRSAHPGHARSEFFQGDRIMQGETPEYARVRGPAARMSSGFTASFNLKVTLCRGHADRRSAHPGRAEASYCCSAFLSFAWTIVVFAWATGGIVRAGNTAHSRTFPSLTDWDQLG
jgi:hypothetical protein